MPAIRVAMGCLLQWAACIGAAKLGIAPSAGFALASCAGIWHFRPSADVTPWSKALRAGMFPASYCALWLASDVPGWAWGVCFGLGWLVFPRMDTGSAPLWRSPKEIGVSLGLALASEQWATKTALDAGCGLGDGVLALRTALPAARVDGVESAWIPWLMARSRCGAGIDRADMWNVSWSGYGLVYLFLRPEAMERAKNKCAMELDGGALVASLDFEFEGVGPWLALEPKEGRILRLYKVEALRMATGLERESDQGVLGAEGSRTVAVSIDKQTMLA